MTIHKAKGLGFDVVIVPGLAHDPDRIATAASLAGTDQVGWRAEEEEQEFVVAPIGRNGKPGDLYDWVGRYKSGGKMLRPGAFSTSQPRGPGRNCTCWVPRP